ncbi:MAG: PHP-associated domain-containing protein [Methanobacteriaceae archaeon]
MLKLDSHIHSCYSGDARGTPREILKQASKIGLNAIAIADHNTIMGSKIAKEDANDFDITVISSIEITTTMGHIIGFGVNEDIKKGLSPYETVDIIHDLGGLAIIPHPFTRYRNGLFTKINPNSIKFDAIEVLNSRYIFGYSNFKAAKLAKKKGVPELGASDSHFIDAIGSAYTEINTEEDFTGRKVTEDEIIEFIKDNKTRAKGTRTKNHLIAREVINKKIRRIY